MKKQKGNRVLLLIFFVGFSVMLYPFFSNYWNSRVQTKAVASYEAQVQNMSETQYQNMFQAAEEYNQELKNIAHPFENYTQIPGYEDVLNITGTGIMGYITIDRIHVKLPIYHGTSEGVLQIGVGHLAGSSLPVGGPGTHTVLSAHRGLPSAKLFSDLDEMEKGDTFQITVLNRVLTYQVDQIHIVEPEDLDDLRADLQKDYCTLMTCTPYGINTHRLLVRGVRVDGQTGPFVAADAYQIEPKAVAVVTMLVMICLWLAGVGFTRIKKRKRNGHKTDI